jgi:hypothetical protein
MISTRKIAASTDRTTEPLGWRTIFSSTAFSGAHGMSERMLWFKVMKYKIDEA